MPFLPSSSTNCRQTNLKIASGASINFQWPFPDFNKPQKWWKFRSRYCLFMVGFFGGKAVLTLLNSFKMRNKEILLDAIYKRPAAVPLITVSNHESCMDDPALIGNLVSLKQLFDQERMRWSLAAHDICYKTAFYTPFFAHGKCIPTIRGLGVYQRAIDFSIERLTNGEWLHIFPEGKVNMDRKELLRLKWGVGRMISELPITPIVIPFWHTGMADVLPNYPPYIPRIGKKVFLNVGQPLKLEPVLRSVEGQSPMQRRKAITDFIQAEMQLLRQETLKLSEEQWKK